MFATLYSTYKRRILQISNVIFGSIFYIIGIGFVSMIAKIFGKTFLSQSYSKTSWQKIDRNYKSRLEKQY